MTTPAPAAPASEPAPVQAPAATQTPPPAPAAPAPTPQPPAVPAPVTEPQDVASLPAWAQQEIRDARDQAARYRIQARDAQTQAPSAPAQAPPAEAPEGDVSRLPQWAQRAINAATEATRTASIQQAVIAAAPAAGADIVRILDSQSAMATLAAIDPTDTAAVTAAIAQALTTHPHLAVSQTGPARAGADFSSQQQTVTAEDFARMGYTERTELRAADPDTYRRLAGT